MQEIEKKIINARINEVLKDWCLDDKPDYLYLKCFGKPCNRYGIFINNQGKIEIKNRIEDFNTNYTKYKPIDYSRFIKELHKNCDLYREFYDNQNDVDIVYFYKNSMTYVYGDSDNVREIIILSDHKPIEFKKFIKELVVEKKKDSTFTYITRAKNGDFDNVILKVNHNNNISLDNYNDDIPYDKMKEFCNKDSSGLMLLSGPAGTGKTSLIKKLIYECEAPFILLSADTLMNIDSTDFMSFLIRRGSGSVLVLEDCDVILKSRDSGGSTNAVSTLLNLSDGILGDALNLKFICTYNTDDFNIDPALIRKGRLKLRYKVGKLAANKVHKINSKYNKAMTLAELYNEEDNDFNTKKNSKMGF
jgi:hypothetical protein